MKKIPILVLSLFILSCSKNKESCIAKDAQGHELFEVVGEDLCEDQISQENGEYCECSL